MAWLYATHYMEEDEGLCDRIGIIDSGRVIAEGTTQQLVATIGEQERLRIETGGDLDGAAEQIRGLPGVSEAWPDERSLVVITDDGARRMPAIIELLTRMHVQIGSIEVTRPDLEAVFLHLTGKALRE